MNESKGVLDWNRSAVIGTLFLLSAIAILGTIVRLHRFNERTMGHIEIYAPNIDMPYELSDPYPRMSFTKTITGTFWEPHPPGWYVSMWFWTSALGSDLFVLRLPSLLAGVSAVLVLFMLARLVEDLHTAILSMALLAFNGHQVLWSQIARPYVVALLLGLTSTLILVLLAKGHRRRNLLLLVYLVVSAAGLSTTYYFWPFFAVHILWVLLIGWSSGRRPNGLFLSQMLTLILTSPLIALAIFQSKESYLLGDPLTFLRDFFGFGFMFERDLDARFLEMLPSTALAFISLLGLLLFLAGLFIRRTEDDAVILPETPIIATRFVFGAAFLASMAIVAAALAFNTKDPSKTNAILVSGVVPIVIAMVASAAQRRSAISRFMAKHMKRIIVVDRPFHLVGLLAIVPISILAIVNLFIPFFASRQALIFVPFLLIVIARGIVRLKSVVGKRLYYAGLIPLTFVLTAAHYGSLEYNYSRPISPNDYRGLFEQWESNILDGDLIFLQRHWVTTPIFYYMSEADYSFVGSNYGEAIKANPDARVWHLSFPGLGTPRAIADALEGYQLSSRIDARRISANLYLPDKGSVLTAEFESIVPHESAVTSAGQGLDAVTVEGVESTVPLEPSATAILPADAVQTPVTPDESGVVPETNGADQILMSLNFSTFLGTPGGSGTLREAVFDSSGDIIVAGSGEFDPNGFQNVTAFGTMNGGTSIFVAKLSSDGSSLKWATIVGGNDAEKGGYGLALDSTDNVYVTGTTFSTDFPTTPGAWDRTHNNIRHQRPDVVLFKLSADGKTLVYSTYLGGDEEDTARGGVSVDNQGFAYVVGHTDSTDYLDEGGVANPAKLNSFLGGDGDGFVTKVSQDGSSIVWSRYIGGSNNQGPESVLGSFVDSQRDIYLHGIVRSSDAFTSPNAFDKSFNGNQSDSYFAKLSADGTQLLYATYFGGSGDEWAEHKMIVDGAGNAYLAGETFSSDFPIVNGHKGSYGGQGDGYLVKFNAAGQIVFSTYVGGSGYDGAFGPALDGLGNIFISGMVESNDLDTTNGAFDLTLGGTRDAFLQAYAPNGNLLYSSYFGGSAYERGRFALGNSDGEVVIVAETDSNDFPTTPGAYDINFNNGLDVIVSKFTFWTNFNPTNHVYLPLLN